MERPKQIFTLREVVRRMKERDKKAEEAGE
jgi:hypothetical protein